jgi:hypothetical protein
MTLYFLSMQLFAGASSAIFRVALPRRPSIEGASIFRQGPRIVAGSGPKMPMQRRSPPPSSCLPLWPIPCRPGIDRSLRPPSPGTWMWVPNPVLTSCSYVFSWSMRSWESARPPSKVGRGVVFQDRMDRHAHGPACHGGRP